ncbi:MAG: putative sulfate exporter family transporter [Nitrospirae bacterium]|nr:putative sulfate exporter family transporter [Nitrospirota bacterium]
MSETGRTFGGRIGKFTKLASDEKHALLISCIVGAVVYGINAVLPHPLFEPLVASMLAGLIIRAVAGERVRLGNATVAASTILIPPGILLYGAGNLNFLHMPGVSVSVMLMLLVVASVFVCVIMAVGKLLGQRDRISYLTAAGSAICGASAIAITAPAVDADSDDISISLIAITLVSIIGLYTLFPLVAITMDFTSTAYAIMSGSLMHFTGFVKQATSDIPHLRGDMTQAQLNSLALSVKSLRYTGLLILIPLFSSLARRRVHIPWYLWGYVAAGTIASLVYWADAKLYATCRSSCVIPAYSVLWSIAMAAIGLGTDVRRLLSDHGVHAFVMAFAGFVAALAVFLFWASAAGLA